MFQVDYYDHGTEIVQTRNAKKDSPHLEYERTPSENTEKDLPTPYHDRDSFNRDSGDGWAATALSKSGS